MILGEKAVVHGRYIPGRRPEALEKGSAGSGSGVVGVGGSRRCGARAVTHAGRFSLVQDVGEEVADVRVGIAPLAIVRIVQDVVVVDHVHAEFDVVAAYLPRGGIAHLPLVLVGQRLAVGVVRRSEIETGRCRSIERNIRYIWREISRGGIRDPV